MRTVIWATVALVASAMGPAVLAGPSSTIAGAVAGPAGSTDEGMVEWVNELPPVALGQAALDALGTADWVGALELAAAELGAAPVALPKAPALALPAVGLAPVGEPAIQELVDAVLAAETLVGSDAASNAQAALLIAQAIDAALPALEALAGPSADGGEQPFPFDLHALTHEFQHLNDARSEGRPIFADMEKMVEWNEALQVYYENPGTGPSVEENMALHNTAVKAPFIHALEHSTGSFQAFVDDVRDFAEGNGAPDALGGTCGVIGAPAPITAPGCAVIITQPGSHIYTAAAENAILIIDLGGFDTYIGQFAGAGPGEVRVAVDVGMEPDLYVSVGAAALGTQGAGVGGVGILVNVGGGDGYVAVGSAGAFGQGYASGAGVGALVDIAGNDFYNLLDVDVVVNPELPFFGAVAEDVTTVSRPTAVRGQGAAVAGGVGALLDVTGVDAYNALAHSAAIQPMFQYGGVLSPGQTVHRNAISGAVSATVQGAASGGSLPGGAPAPPAGGLPGVGLQVDASLPTEGNAYNAMAVSFASGWVHSQAPPQVCGFDANFFFVCFPPPPVARFCDGTSGAADVRAQGAGFGNLGIAASASSGGLILRNIEAASVAIGECYEVGSGVHNAPMVSSATSGATTALGQGYGTGTGAGALVNALASSFNRLLSDSVAIGCSQCFGSGVGACGGDAVVGSANAAGQGAGSGSLGIGASVSLGPTGSNDYAAGAYESANAWAMTLGAGEIGSQTTTYLGATPPTVRVQGSSSGGGIGALVDVGGTDAYNTQVPWALAVFPGQIGGAPPFPLGVERVTQTFIGFLGGTVVTLGNDLDKGEREGTTGIALFADIGNSFDIYLENGVPASGALNGGNWGTAPSVASLGPPPTLEIGIDR